MNPSSEFFRRARICFTVKACSPLHIGTGERRSLSERVPKKREALAAQVGDSTYNPTATLFAKQETTAANEQPVLRGKAYIPGSTLKGAMRADMARLIKDDTDELLMELFGSVHEAQDKENEKTWVRQIGRVRFRDSGPVQMPQFKSSHPSLWMEEHGTSVQSRVSIDPITGTARKNHLAFHEVIPEGSTLTFQLEASGISKDALTALANWLDQKEDQSFRLGAGASLCAGDLHVQSLQIAILTDEDLAAFLKGDKNETNAKFKEFSYEKGGAKSEQWTAGFTFETVDPLLVTSGLERDEKNKTGEKTGEHTDQLTPIFTTQGHVRIPASTVRGAFRARCRKILILWIRELWEHEENLRPKDVAKHDHAASATAAGKQADHLLAKMFGDTGLAGTIQFSDFLTSEALEAEKLHHQFFNAIDRFTGGLLPGALYDARAVPPGVKFQGRILLRPNTSLPAWAQLLLKLAFRDLYLGDFALGWGKAKGFGSIISNDKDPLWPMDSQDSEAASITDLKQLYEALKTALHELENAQPVKRRAPMEA